MSHISEELQSVRYSSFNDIFTKFRELSNEYGNLPVDSLTRAFGSIGFGNMQTYNPYTQNSRVKSISSLPAHFTKEKVAKMVRDANNNEMPLRQVEHGLEFTSYPLLHTRMVYQALLTYHNFIAPHMTVADEAKKPEFWREYRLLEKMRKDLNPAAYAHQYVGQAFQEGKIFVHPRISVDKSHNKVNHAFIQQLPSDWCKIVGFNNKSKYTIAFNLMYFTKMGTSWTQYGDLFKPYFQEFNDAVVPTPTMSGGRLVYAADAGINLDAVKHRDNVEAYFENGKWFYWVYLPIDEVFPMEIDDAITTVVSPFVGLFLNLIQLSQMEQIQLSLLQNPLVSVVLGEIPYHDTKDANVSDQYMLSNAGRLMFEAAWYQMMQANNTSGIGLYMAPLRNMKLESLAEAPSAMDIVSQGYTDTMAQAGLTGIIPTNADARAGAVQVSLMIESRIPQTIYTCFERMMNCVIENMNLRFDWRFEMFGDIATDSDMIEEVRRDMTLGVLPATIIYNALHDRSVLDDIAWSDAIAESGLLDKRIPLVTSYTMGNANTTLPPQPEENRGGRPASEEVTSEGNEQDQDADTGEL